jgi:hypothetical protein
MSFNPCINFVNSGVTGQWGPPIDDEDNVIFLMRGMLVSYRGLMVPLRGQPNMMLQTLITYLLPEEILMKNLGPLYDIVIALFIINNLQANIRMHLTLKFQKFR